ncbi:TerB family tellurite resistance protein [Alkaliflexus imshenetskii]|uniref:TerB family tellurite resistance protein n=1 Tax=Alkaliflexus imshenetskii TaxID=286730 RepID=UPI00047B5771|nr:TerB family tellurite resistance protein [Alkaliflexus imshenetskii]
MKFLKLLFSAGIGWWMFGPIGGILGMIIGNMINVEVSNQPFSKQRDGFVASMLVLMAAVMKSDGRVLKSELEYVKLHLTKLLGPDQTAQALIVLRDILKKDIPLHDVCHQVRVNMDYNSRVQLIHLLFGLGKADGALTANEVQTIHTIAVNLGVSESDYQSLLNMFYDNIDGAYKVLEIASSATDEEVKKAYRKMAVRFHPDKVNHLGEEFQESAKEKFQKVNEAYEKIKRERGMV